MLQVATFGVDMLTEAGHGQEHEHLEALRGAVTAPAWCKGSLALLHDVRDNPTHTEKVRVRGCVCVCACACVRALRLGLSGSAWGR
jgi:hypothetical protein